MSKVLSKSGFVREGKGHDVCQTLRYVSRRDSREGSLKEMAQRFKKLTPAPTLIARKRESLMKPLQSFIGFSPDQEAGKDLRVCCRATAPKLISPALSSRELRVCDGAHWLGVMKNPGIGLVGGIPTS